MRLFWLLLDALCADQNVMRTCLSQGWDFYISFRDTDMPALQPLRQAPFRDNAGFSNYWV